MNPATTADLASRIGYAITDAGLLTRALTHGSHSNQSGGSNDYQRLEFLGDRVLGLIIAETLYARFPDAREGALSARLNQLVSRETCAEVARSIGVGPFIRLGKQARDDGARDSDNVLGDVMEALIGAIYIDGGLHAARACVTRHWADRFDAVVGGAQHPKSALLEWAAANRKKPPEYVVTDRQGPDHAPRFTVQVTVANAGQATAEGHSKQDAEKNAAAALMAKLRKEA